jgi:hypothetical protein
MCVEYIDGAVDVKLIFNGQNIMAIKLRKQINKTAMLTTSRQKIILTLITMAVLLIFLVNFRA